MQLVFLDQENYMKAVPFTTSKIISERIGNKHSSITRLIRDYENHIEEFGKVGFKNEPLPNSKTNQSEKIYDLNEQQAYFLLTLLRNNQVVIEFKKNLVKAFFVMKNEIMKCRINRQDLKPTRKTLTDEIQDNPNHKEWDYKNLTNLIYKMVTGKIAVTLRKERGAEPKAIAIDYMTADEIALVEKFTYKIAVLYEMGLDYHQIKAMLLNRQMIGKISVYN